MSRVEITVPPLGPEAPPDQDGPDGRALPRTVLAVLAAGCAAVLVVAGARLAGELTRAPTPGEVAAARVAEVAARYRAWPAGRIFPATLGYTLDLGSAEHARRVGIAPGTGCADGVDAPLGESLTARGCRALLRATYLDQPQGLAVTVGVIVFPDGGAARDAAKWIAPGGVRPGLRALPFPGTAAERFGDAARQTAAVRHAGPYVVAATAGYADGRPATRAPRQADLASIAPRLAAAVLDPLATPGTVDCDAREWAC
ncbi:hypothetical protein [Actinomadura flavalba]|uniref:hypothetical protein n=1 Tax=Actinomadura flavalba TaxID=1120938 RepID=UPI000371626D|nr:hypothetical protein [Actinomadura flavalba]